MDFGSFNPPYEWNCHEKLKFNICTYGAEVDHTLKVLMLSIISLQVQSIGWRHPSFTVLLVSLAFVGRGERIYVVFKKVLPSWHRSHGSRSAVLVRLAHRITPWLWVSVDRSERAIIRWNSCHYGISSVTYQLRSSYFEPSSRVKNSMQMQRRKKRRRKVEPDYYDVYVCPCVLLMRDV